MYCITFFAKAQSNDSDSIHRQLELIHKMPLDTAQVSQLRNMGHDLMEHDSLLSKQLLEEALTKSLAIKETNAITSSYRTMGIWYSFFNNTDKALEYYRLSLKSANSNNNQYLIAGANLNIGNIKYWKGEYDSCIHFYLKAAEIFENPKILKDKSITERQLDLRKSDLYSNISTVFNTLKNLIKADEYIDKSIAIAKKYTTAAAVSTLARYMQIKADNYSENGQTEKALRIRLQFLSQMENGVDLKTFLQGAYQSIAQEYFSLKKIDSSKLFAQKSLQVANTIKSPSDIANANWQLGRISIAENQYPAADKYMEAAKDYYLTTDDPTEQRSYFDVMRELKFAEGKYKEAYVYFEKFHALNDSLLISEKQQSFLNGKLGIKLKRKIHS
ncbi:MAG: hypothetical protein IPI78_06440 [Chitinophagaceae bacterium]|nr:hypothetical protein [Chitinophagaceae bacterium]